MMTLTRSRTPARRSRAGRKLFQGLLLCALGFGAGTPALAGWQLQWIDPFDGSGVDWNNWSAQTAADYNNEIQCYTDNDDPATGNHNYEVSGGTLTIIARKQSIFCPDLVFGAEFRTWTSGRLNSKDKREFLYGRLEARIRFLTEAGGTWPAFWMLENRIAEQPINPDDNGTPTDDNVGWPNPGAGEIDVWEWSSNNPNTYITNFYNQSFGCLNGLAGDARYHLYTNGFEDVNDWHVYAIEWYADEARFYYDDTLVRTQDLSSCNQYQEPMFALLNVAIGGNLGGTVADALTEARMEVDYVAHCTATTANSTTRCNGATPGLAQNLVIFADSERADWAAWDSNGGTTPAVVADSDPFYGQAMQFDIVGSTVVGFTTRAPFATGGKPYDASGIVDTGTLEFDLKMTESPLAGPADWKLKVESDGSAAQAVEVGLGSSIEGHPAPELNTWQHYSFRLSDLDLQGNLDLSAIDLVLVFPEFGAGNGAQFRIDNVRILTNVAQNPVTNNDSGDSGGGGSGGGGGSADPPWMLMLGFLLLRRARARRQ